MALQPSNLRNALASIHDSDSGKDIVSAGMIRDVQTDGDDISIDQFLEGPCPFDIL